MRAADKGRALFADRSQFADIIAPETIAPGAPVEVAHAMAAEVVDMALDAGCTADDLSVIQTALQDLRTTPLTDATRIESREACVQAFNEEFGEQAHSVWVQTRAWVAADPRRAAILAQVGDSPEVAVRAARMALAAQRRR